MYSVEGVVVVLDDDEVVVVVDGGTIQTPGENTLFTNDRGNGKWEVAPKEQLFK